MAWVESDVVSEQGAWPGWSRGVVSEEGAWPGWCRGVAS